MSKPLVSVGKDCNGCFKKDNLRYFILRYPEARTPQLGDTSREVNINSLHRILCEDCFRDLFSITQVVVNETKITVTPEIVH